MYEENLSPAEKELESALGKLKPTANTLSRDVLMFNAGRASTGKKRPWQILSGMLAIVLFSSVMYRPKLDGTGHLSYKHEVADSQMTQTPYQPVQSESPGSMAYPILRQKVVKYGLDALRFQQDRGRSEQHKSKKELLESMLSS
jgi:hypothetical protein